MIAFSVQVSIDSPDKKRFASIRPNADLDQIVENLRLLQKIRKGIPTKRRPFLSINIVLMKSTLKDLPAMVMFTMNIGADHLEICRLVIHTKDMEPESLAECKSEYNGAILETKLLAESMNLSIAIPPLFVIASEVEKEKEVLCNSHSENMSPAIRQCPFLWNWASNFI